LLSQTNANRSSQNDDLLSGGEDDERTATLSSPLDELWQSKTATVLRYLNASVASGCGTQRTHAEVRSYRQTLTIVNLLQTETGGHVIICSFITNSPPHIDHLHNDHTRRSAGLASRCASIATLLCL